MSHWKKFSSNVLANVDKGILAKAVKDLGVEMDESIISIRNTWGNETVDAGLTKDGKAIALGFNFKDNEGKTELELSGDFYGTGLNEEEFIDKLSQAYQKHNAIEKLEAEGWSVNSVEFNEKKEIEIEASQWS